jgi:hypothetical protein
MRDNTETLRRGMVKSINDNPAERELLERFYGQVWDTKQLQEDFAVEGFMAPFCSVTRKEDGARGALLFQHHPRYYWGFQGVGDKE